MQVSHVFEHRSKYDIFKYRWVLVLYFRGNQDARFTLLRSRYHRSCDEQDHLNIVLKNVHKLSGPPCCVKLIPEGEDTAPSRERIKLDDKLREKIQARIAVESGEPICRICKTLVANPYWDRCRYSMMECVLPNTPDGITYHLRML